MKTNDEEFLKLLGSTVKKYRTNLNLSQEKFASLAGFHPTYISQVERGKRNISLLSLKRVCSALNCPLNIFFEDMGQI